MLSLSWLLELWPQVVVSWHLLLILLLQAVHLGLKMHVVFVQRLKLGNRLLEKRITCFLMESQVLESSARGASIVLAFVIISVLSWCSLKHVLRVALVSNLLLLTNFSFDFCQQMPKYRMKTINSYFYCLLKLTCWKHCSLEWFLVLWKSYMLSWRTNDEKLLCLK